MNLTYNHRRAEVLRYLGHRNQAVPENIENLLETLIPMGVSAASPKHTFGFFDVCETEDGISLVNTPVTLIGKDIREHFAGAVKCAVMAVTLGADFDRAFLKYQATDTLASVIFDAVGSTLAEEEADICEAEIKAEAEKLGLGIKFRFSAGYGDFPIEMQGELLSLISAEKRIGLTLTDSNIMLPRKSVSAVIPCLKNM